MALTNIQSSGVGQGQYEFSANIRLRFEEMASEYLPLRLRGLI
jgi:hypothetical protein